MNSDTASASGSSASANSAAISWSLRRNSANLSGLSYLWQQSVIRSMAIMVGVMNLAMIAVMAILVLFVVAPGPVGLTEVGFGLLMIGIAIAAVIPAPSSHPVPLRLDPVQCGADRAVLRSSGLVLWGAPSVLMAR